MSDADKKRQSTETAGWWRQSLATSLRDLPLRRHALSGLALLGGASLGAGCLDVPAAAMAQDRDEMELSARSIDLQRAQGWSVGGPTEIALTGASPVDADGSTHWKYVMDRMAELLAPRQQRLLPYYVPTLFQSVAGEAGAALRDLMRPIITPAMGDAYERGLSVLSLFEDAGRTDDTALVVDAPGPQSVAIAAALADRFEPVFLFDNWPHPLGVVPSQETLAAALYYLPQFERQAAVRPASAPPLFVLDANRLNEYRDENNRFDNRYIARLPPSERLATLGVRHVLYVTAEESPVEADDLNEDFVDLARSGIAVKQLALSDLQPLAPGEDEEVADKEPEPDGAPSVWIGASFSGPRFVYGGDQLHHRCFWRYYGWYSSPRAPTLIPPPPARGSRGWWYHPTARATLFSGGAAPGFATARGPAGFGQVRFRSSRADGSFTGWREARAGSGGAAMGGTFSRSGSLGRFHASMGGG
jgi:hypothetical protein